MKKSFVLVIVALMTTISLFSQEKPIRIGVKIGVPNVVGLNLEYVTPLLNERLAPTADFSYFSIADGMEDFKFSYFEIGGNYYFKEDGKGFYGHASYGNINLTVTQTDGTYGVGEGKASMGLLNFKIGGKWGNAFYFRTELGYGLFLGDGEVEVNYNDYQGGYSETEDVPTYLSGGPLFNIGFGFAF